MSKYNYITEENSEFNNIKKSKKHKLYIGAYISTSHFSNLLNALEITKKIGANVLQIYMGDSVYTSLSKKLKMNKEEIKICKKYINNNKFKFFIHSILSLNFCKDPFHKRNEWQIINIIYDMNLCYSLGGEGVVLHLGTYKTDKLDLSYEEGINNFIQSLILVLDKTKKIPIILETPVNKNYRIGSTIENLSEIYHKIPLSYRDRIKICIDTQHIFASGYNIRSKEGMKNYFLIFDKLIGIKNLALIHLNDSDKEYNSHINRHQSLKEGFIFKNNGDETLKYIMHFLIDNNIPALMESNYDNYKKEIIYLKKLVGGTKDIKNKIIKIFKYLLYYYQTRNNINNSNKYRIDSYKKAIKYLEKLETPIYTSKNLIEKSILGKSLLEKIDEIAKTGTLKQFENIKNLKRLNSIEKFQNIWGIGPKFAKEITNKKIYSINNLKKAINENKIKLSKQQLIGLKYYDDLKKKLKRVDVEEYSEYLKNLFKNYPIKIINAGSYRSGKENLGDIDIIVTLLKLKNVNNNYINITNINNIFYNKLKDENILFDYLLTGKNKNIYIIKLPNKLNFIKIDVAFIEEKNLPWYLLYFGSSREFSKKIRLIASKLGYKLNEKGLFDKITNKKINFNPKSEEDIFNYLKIAYVKPENRI